MERLDFDVLIKQVEGLGTTAQATLMYRLSRALGPAVLRSSIRYSFQQLDRINAQLPDGHPYKERYKRMPNDRKDQTYQQPDQQPV